MNTSNILTLNDLNNKQIQKLVSPILYHVVLMIFGIPGNLTVLLVYRKQFSNSVYKTIIWNVALVDFLFCTIGIPFNIGELIRYYTFYELWACKLFAVLIIFAVIYCSHLLVILAVFRFLQVYMPLKTQITPKNVKYCIAAGFCFAILFDLPQAIFQPIVEVKLENNITGYVCAITYHTTVYADVYNGFLILLFAFYSLLLLTLYLLIGRKMYLQRKYKQSSQSDKISGKITKIAFSVSLVFALSYLPIFVIKLIASEISQEELTTAQFAVLKIFERSYVVNHVTNPFIYAFFDQRFRKQFFNLYRTVFYHRPKHNESQSVGSLDNSTKPSDLEETTVT